MLYIIERCSKTRTYTLFVFSYSHLKIIAQFMHICKYNFAKKGDKYVKNRLQETAKRQ